MLAFALASTRVPQGGINGWPLFCSLNSGQSLTKYSAHNVRSVMPRLASTRSLLTQWLLWLAAGGPELITVCIDFDERVLRMGFGDLSAVEILRDQVY